MERYAVKIQKPYAVFLGTPTDHLAAKVGVGIARWRRQHCVAQVRGADSIVDLGLPDMTVSEAHAAGAKTLVIGVAPRGGGLDDTWIPTLVSALENGLDLAAGLHTQLNKHAVLSAAAKKFGRRMIDVRSEVPSLSPGTGLPRMGSRILTVGTDCSVGKMHTSLHLVEALRKNDVKARFVATGQTGILIEGSGICVDAVVSDFVAGAVEQLSPSNPECIDVIEGQGSLFHPSYAAVSLGLLHGSQPDWLVVCHEVTRQHMRGLPEFELPSLSQCLETNLFHARLTNPDVRCLGFAINTSEVSIEEAREIIEKIETEFSLPATDPERFGAGRLLPPLNG